MFRLTILSSIGGAVVLLFLVACSGGHAQEAAESAPAKLSSQEAIEKALETKCSCDFDEIPLSEVVAFLAHQRKINFIIDRRALEDEGIDAIETSVTLKVSDVPFKSLLALALEPHDLTWTIRHEVLIVTTEDEAESHLVTRVYDVFDLLVDSADGGDRNKIATDDVDFDSLIELIESSIQPDTWDTVGGLGHIDGFVRRSIGALVVSQSAPIHLEISALLDSLRKKRKQPTRERKQKTREAAAKQSDTSVRVVAYQVFTRGGLKGTTGEQELIEILKEFVEPESWTSDGVAARAIPGALVIKQKRAVHEKIRRLLTAAGVLQKAASKRYYDPVEDDAK